MIAKAAGSRVTTYVWLILSALTVVSWFLATRHGPAGLSPSAVITVAVIAMAFVKGRLIIWYFMEVRTAPMWICVFTDVWLVVLCASVLGIYFYPSV